MGVAEIAGGIAAMATGFGGPLGAMLLSSGIVSEASVIAAALGSKSGLGVTTRTPAQPRQIIRGIQRVGGTIIYCSTTGSTKNQYNLVIAIASHPCWAIENLYLDGRQVFWEKGSVCNQTVNGYNFGGNPDGNDHEGPNGVQYNFGGKVFCAAFYGKQTSAPDGTIGNWTGPTVINGNDPPSYGGYCLPLWANDPVWAPNAQGTPYLAGCTWVYLKLEYDSATFPQFPEIRFTVHGKSDILDPRGVSTQVMSYATVNAHSASGSGEAISTESSGEISNPNGGAMEAQMSWSDFAWPDLPPGAVVTAIKPVITYTPSASIVEGNIDLDPAPYPGGPEGPLATFIPVLSTELLGNDRTTWTGPSIGITQEDLENCVMGFNFQVDRPPYYVGSFMSVFSIALQVSYYNPDAPVRQWTSNWALQIADVLMDPTWGLGDTTVNMDQLIAAANVCDEQVECLATNMTSWEADTYYFDGDEFYANGQAWEVTRDYISGAAWGEDDTGNVIAITTPTQTEARYALHLHYDATMGPGDILDQMMPAAAGRLSRIGGEWFIWPAYWQGPSFSFDENVLLDKIQWEGKKSLAELCNRITGTYIAPNYPYNVAGDLYDSNGFWQGQTQNNFPFSFQPTNYPMYACDKLHGYDEDIYLVADTPNQGAYDLYAEYADGATVIYGGVPWEANEAVPAGKAPGALDGSGNPYWSPAGSYLPREVPQNCVLSVSQAQRVAKIILLRCRQQGSGTLVMNAAAFAMQPIDVMQFTSPTFGWTDKLLEIAGLSGQRLKLRLAAPPNAAEGDSTPAFFVEVPVNETDPSVYEWDFLTEEMTPYDVPAMGAGAVSTYIVGAPSDLIAISDLATALVQPDGSLTPRIELLWTEDADTYVTNGGTIRIQIEPAGSGYWHDVLLLSGQATQAFLGNVVSGQYYDVRIAGVRPSGAQSGWVEVDNILVGPPLSPPPAPAGFWAQVVAISGTEGSLSGAPAALVGLFKNGQRLTALGSYPDFYLDGAALTVTVAADPEDLYIAVYGPVPFTSEIVAISGTEGTLSGAPTSLIGLFKNGQRLTQLGSAPDFSLSGSAITLSEEAVDTDFFEAVYGLGTVFDEIVAISGVSGSFSYSPSYLAGFFEDGLLLSPLGSAPDYAISGLAITLTDPESTGEIYEAVYLH
jgi:hypothetical protein